MCMSRAHEYYSHTKYELQTPTLGDHIYGFGCFLFFLDFELIEERIAYNRAKGAFSVRARFRRRGRKECPRVMSVCPCTAVSRAKVSLGAL